MCMSSPSMPPVPPPPPPAPPPPEQTAETAGSPGSGKARRTGTALKKRRQGVSGLKIGFDNVGANSGVGGAY